MTRELSDASFNEIVTNNKAVVVDFWAQWCGPCKTMLPVLEELSQTYEGKILVGKVDVDQNQSLCEQFEIMNIPTMLFFKNGKLVNRHVGAGRKEDVAKYFDQLL